MCSNVFIISAVAPWLLRLPPDRAALVRALAGDIMLCSWARHYTFTVSLATQVYKWIPANLMLREPYNGLVSHPGGVEIFLAASCYGNRDKHRPDGLLGLYADLPYLLHSVTYSIIAHQSVKHDCVYYSS